MSASRLARILDQEMLERAGGSIAAATTPESALPRRPGRDVLTELGGRYLIRYMLRRQLGQFAAGSTDRHFVTPTPLTRLDVRSFLALPAVSDPRPFAMLIDPGEVSVILGPRWVRGGSGIEYLLPEGFPPAALVLGWEIEVK